MDTFNFESLNLKKVKKAIDIGCGNGRHLKSLGFRLKKAEIFGVDQLEHEIHKLNNEFDTHVCKNGNSYSFSVQDIRAISFEDNSFDMVICSEVLEHVPNFEKVIKEYSTRRNILVNDIRQIPGVTCPLPKGAFYCIAELPVKNAETFCQWLLESFHIDNTTVMLAPANGFYNKKNLICNQVRIAYVLESSKLRTAANIIKKGLQEYSD